MDECLERHPWRLEVDLVVLTLNMPMYASGEAVPLSRG